MKGWEFWHFDFDISFDTGQAYVLGYARTIEEVCQKTDGFETQKIADCEMLSGPKKRRLTDRSVL